MKFDVYGRFQVEVAREGERWVAYRLEPGKRTKLNELAIPSLLWRARAKQFGRSNETNDV